MRRRMMLQHAANEGGNVELTFPVYLTTGDNGDLGTAVYNWVCAVCDLEDSNNIYNFSSEEQIYIDNKKCAWVMACCEVAGIPELCYNYTYRYHILADGSVERCMAPC